MMNENEYPIVYHESYEELLNLAMERDARRYDKAYAEKDEVKLA